MKSTLRISLIIPDYLSMRRHYERILAQKYYEVLESVDIFGKHS